MNKIISVSASLLLTACASPTLLQTTPDLSFANSGTKLPEKLNPHVITAMPVPIKPQASIRVIDGSKNACFDTDGTVQLNQLYTTAIANTDIITTANDANTKLVAAYNYLIDVIALQEQQIQFLNQQYQHSETLRAKEQQSNEMWDLLSKALISAIAIFK